MKPRVGLLLGDPTGVGPELVAKLLSQPETSEQAKIIVIGSHDVYRRGEKISQVSSPIQVVSSIEAVDGDDDRPSLVDALEIDLADAPLGRVSRVAGQYVLQALSLVLEYAQAGHIDAFCYASFNKEAMHLAGNPFPDELHFIADKLGVDGVFRELNIAADLWFSRVSSHVPLREAAQHVTVEGVRSTIELTYDTMRRAGFAQPKIAVAGLNPHGGDGGLIGREEIDILQPAVKEAQDKDIDVYGPFPPDAIFPLARDGAYDAVVTMYHDQGQIAMKLMSADYGITVHGGLPFPVTTPAHGTAFDIVGQGIARVEALRQSFLMCCRMATIRRAGAAS